MLEIINNGHNDPSPMNLKNSGNLETQPSMLHNALDLVGAAGRDGRLQDCGGSRSSPAGRRSAPCRAPHRKDRTASFSLYKNAVRTSWRFKDHATGEQGGLVAFVMLAGMDEKAAARWLMERCNNDEYRMTNDERSQNDRSPNADCGSERTIRASDFIRHSVIRHSSFPQMPVDAMSAWNEGLDHMEANPECAALLATLRGWPKEFARYLVECACVSMPLYHGARTHAFLVKAPTPGRRCARHSKSRRRLPRNPSP